jgi:hypothetical protein
MKCSAGVLVAAMVVLLGALLTYVMAAGVLFGFMAAMQASPTDTAPMPPGFTPEALRYVGIAMTVVLAGCATLAAVTGVGLIRLWRWSRYSIIVWGGILVAMGTISAVAILFMPMPVPEGSAATLKIVKIVMTLFYGLWVAVGLWFVIFFTRKSVADQFLRGLPNTPPLRPVSISVIAWLMIVNGPSMALMVLMHAPAMFLGVVMQGTAAAVFYVGYGAVSLAVGIGLLRMKPIAYWCALGYYAFGLLNGVALAIPSVWQRYWAALRSLSPIYSQPSPFTSGPLFMMTTIALSVGVPAFFLLTRKQRYLDACITTAGPS